MTDAEPGPDRARSIFETLRASNLFGKPADREAEVVDPNGNPRDSARDDGSPTNISPEQTGARPNEAAAPSPGQGAVGASAERTSDPPSTDGSDPRPMDGQGATEAPSDGQGSTEAPSALSSLGPNAVDEQPAPSGPEQRDGLSEIRLEQASQPDLAAGGDVGESASASPAPTSPQTGNAGSPPSGATTGSANAGPPPAPTSPEGANAGSPPPGATPHPGPVAAAASVDSHETGAPAPAEPSDLVSAPSEKLPQNPPGSSSETASEPPGQASDLPETPASALGAPSADAPGGEEAPAAPTRPAAQLAEAPDAVADLLSDLSSEGQTERSAGSAESAMASTDGGWEHAYPLTTPHPAALAHPLPRVLAVANQKGGVGKTTTTVNLGAALAELGYRVLVVDLDPQGNATTGLGVNARNLDSSVYDVILHDVPIEDVIEPTTLRNLFVVPATIDLAGAEIELVPVFSRELRLKRALASVTEDFDYVLIDCPPSLGLLTVNALAAAGEVLVPIQCEYYALEGLGQLLRNVGLVQGNLNSRLDVSTIILTMYDARTKLAEQVAEDVRTHFGAKVCRTIIPRTVRISEAPSFGQPITVFDPSSRGATAYRELAKEVSNGASSRAG